MRVEIDRFDSEEDAKQTEGVFTIFDVCDEVCFRCYTLELPWLDNAKRVSCIPKGEYKVTKRWSTKYKNHFHVLDVPNRSYILIHNGNYNWHTKGCILVGKTLTDINNDGLKDVTSSKSTLKKIYSILPDTFYLTIK